LNHSGIEVYVAKIKTTFVAFTHKGFWRTGRNLMFVKTVFQVSSNFTSAIYSRLSILSINDISRGLGNTKILLYKLFFRYLVVKPAWVNAALGKVLTTFGLVLSLRRFTPR